MRAPWAASAAATASTRACTAADTGHMRVGAPHRHAQAGGGLGQQRQVHAQAARLQHIRAGHQAQGGGQVVGRPGQRADDRDVGGCERAAQRMATHRQQVPRGLVAEHAAVVRRVADGAADVAADLQPGQARCQRRRRAARRAARRAPCATGSAWCRRWRCSSGSRPAGWARWSCRTRWRRPRPAVAWPARPAWRCCRAARECPRWWACRPGRSFP
jgi:hypothetical protein